MKKCIRSAQWSLIIAMLLYTGCGLLSMEEYRNPGKGFSMDYPKNWEKREDSSGMDIIFLEPGVESSGRYRRNVAVIASEVPSGAVASDTYRLQFNAISSIAPKLSNFKLHTNKYIMIDGIQWKQMTFTYEIDGVRLKVISRAVIKDNKGYVIMGTSDNIEGFLDQYKKIADSFRFL